MESRNNTVNNKMVKTQIKGYQQEVEWHLMILEIRMKRRMKTLKAYLLSSEKNIGSRTEQFIKVNGKVQ